MTNSNSERIYGDVVNINTLKTKELYNERAERLSQMHSPYTSVLLGDQNPEYADKWDAEEKKIILPFLDVEKTSSVLDLGCGIGRWAENLIPLSGQYTGVDFSEGMIRSAEERCSSLMKDNTRFICSSVQDYLDTMDNNIKYDVIIISYVCMYINDNEIDRVIEKILQCASEKCSIYFIDTVGLKDRLTLNEIYSKALKSNYSAIYRTISELKKLYFQLEKKGFSEVSCGFMPKLNNEKEFSETDRYYTILKRI